LDDKKTRLQKELEHLTKAFKAGIMDEDEYNKGRSRIEEKISRLDENIEDKKLKNKIVSEIIDGKEGQSSSDRIKHKDRDNMQKTDIEKKDTLSKNAEVKDRPKKETVIADTNRHNMEEKKPEEDMKTSKDPVKLSQKKAKKMDKKLKKKKEHNDDDYYFDDDEDDDGLWV